MTDNGMVGQSSTALTVPAETGAKLNKSGKSLAIAHAKALKGSYIPHLGMAEVRALADTALRNNRHGERDRLLILVLFDACLRVSEGLGLCGGDVKRDENGGWHLDVLGKGNKPGVVAVSSSLAEQLQAYCWRRGLQQSDRLFPIDRTRAFQIIDKAMREAGIAKPDHVGAVHVLRHSGAIERLRATGNPRALQEHLRHASATMTMRYLKTLSVEEALAIEQGVDFGW